MNNNKFKQNNKAVVNNYQTQDNTPPSTFLFSDESFKPKQKIEQEKATVATFKEQLMKQREVNRTARKKWT
jgi:hypothetical protein